MEAKAREQNGARGKGLEGRQCLRATWGLSEDLAPAGVMGSYRKDLSRVRWGPQV